MALKRVSKERPIVIKKTIQGEPGKPGTDGKDGITTVVTKTVQEPGIPGRDGADGKDGSIPEHQVRNGEIRFKNPDGTWGPWVVFSSHSGGGPDSYNTYTLIEQANFRVQRSSLTFGTNILGVNFNGDVTIILPNGIDKRILVIVKDESSNAATNNITITTES